MSLLRYHIIRLRENFRFCKNLIQEFVFRVFRSKALFGQIFNNFKSTNLDFDWDSGFRSKP